jgi:hypothetical protein
MFSNPREGCSGLSSQGTLAELLLQATPEYIAGHSISQRTPT